MPVPKVHFGYTDGLTATPSIRGGPERALTDQQPPCEPWLFVLLDESENYQLPSPPDFWRNGSFGVFKMMSRTSSDSRTSSRPMPIGSIRSCWRPNSWPLAERDSARALARNGRTLRGIRSGAPGRLRVRQKRRVGRSTRCAVPVRCPHPAGASTRAARGRAGQTGRQHNSHRLVRRGMPYGPAYDPRLPYDGIERGCWGISSTRSSRTGTSSCSGSGVNDSAFVGKVHLHPKSKTRSSDPTIRRPASSTSPRFRVRPCGRPGSPAS